MIRYYSIAGHIIKLTADSSCGVWSSCANYTPFEVPFKEGTDCLCELDIADELAVPPFTEVIDVKTPDFPRLRIGRSVEGWVLETAPEPGLPIVARLTADKNFSHARMRILDDGEKMVRFAVDNAFMIMFAISSSTAGTLEIHSSVTVCDGRAYAFLGKSGTGKSTHSRLWRQYIPGSTLLNDDNPIIRAEDGSVRIYGSPWSGKTPCYKSESYPLAAIVRLRQAPENRIRRLGAVEAYASLFPSCSAFREVSGSADGIHSTLAEVIGKVPVYQLDCLPDKEAAELCHSTVSGL